METWPSRAQLIIAKSRTPAYMQPNDLPFACVLPGFLNDAQCDAIVEQGEKAEPYKSPHCNATTRELDDSIEMLSYIYGAATMTNDVMWKYALSSYKSWMQSYSQGDKYRLHADTAPGQTRKLTAVALLSDPSDYSGGDLVLRFAPKTYTVPKTRGTVAIFLPWLHHEVTTVERGKRQTINMGFWGPPFR